MLNRSKVTVIYILETPPPLVISKNKKFLKTTTRYV